MGNRRVVERGGHGSGLGKRVARSNGLPYRCLPVVRHWRGALRKKVTVASLQTGGPSVRSEGDTSENKSAILVLTPICDFSSG